MWATVRPATRSANEDVPRARTASIASPSESIRTTTPARANTSLGHEATCAPAARTAAVFPAVRFHTTSGVPARSRFSAMGSPMSPSPMKPTPGP